MAFQGHQARKRFGQHWLKDQTVLDRIVAAADLRPSDRVLAVSYTELRAHQTREDRGWRVVG